MSYCRFSEGDVYAYACEGGVQFWVAGGNKQLDRLCNTYDSAYQYAKYLRDECGLDVPSHAINALRADALDEADHGDGSAVTEIVSENARLRELCKDIWNDALHFEGFWDYVHDDGTIYREDELPHYQERMRKLGIEVH